MEYPSKILLENTTKKINEYIQIELKQKHSVISTPWVVESLRQEYYWALEGGLDTSDSLISSRVLDRSKPQIMRMYTDTEMYLEDLPGILSGRANDDMSFDAGQTSYGDPMPRGVYVSRTRNDGETYRNPIDLVDVE